MASRLITMRKGESIFIDFQKKDGATIDVTMEASYSLLDSNDTEEFNGVCGKSGDLYTFEMRVSGATTADLQTERIRCSSKSMTTRLGMLITFTKKTSRFVRSV